jgi:hypothetical protein
MDVFRAGSGLHRQGQGPQGPLNSPEPEPLNSPEPEGPQPVGHPGHWQGACPPSQQAPQFQGPGIMQPTVGALALSGLPRRAPPGQFSPGRILAGQLEEAARDATEWKQPGDPRADSRLGCNDEESMAHDGRELPTPIKLAGRGRPIRPPLEKGIGVTVLPAPDTKGRGFRQTCSVQDLEQQLSVVGLARVVRAQARNWSVPAT